MLLVRWTMIVAAGFLIITSAHASMPVDPLFESDTILDVRLTLPLATLQKERLSEEELAAKFQYTNEAGETIELDVEVRARGRYRRRSDVCRVPPIRLDFKTSTTINTLFESQDKLKLVTHCKSTHNHSQAVAREHLTYQILNIISDASYRVRLLRITYVDTDDDLSEDVQMGFVIEHKSRLARRTGKSVLEIPRTSVAALHPEYTNLVSLFHFMIGNTDFSQILGAAGEPCCHNHVLFTAGSEPIYSIPYDFDQSGIVAAPHASPNPKFRLKSTRQRLYRGRCVNNQLLPTTIRHYVDLRERILEQVAEHPALSSSARKRVASYLNAFYKVIASEKKVRSALIKKCI